MSAGIDPADRVAAARKRGTVARYEAFERVGLNDPARAVLLRGFKHERVLEVWATNDPTPEGTFRLLGSYPILGASGNLGPKRREGDRQVPEGFYRVTRFNPCSRFHLSLGLDYPNAADRLLTTDPLAPGSDIFIHGGTESKGCLAMGDLIIELIYLVARDAEEVSVHLFPCRMHEGHRRILQPTLMEDPNLEKFWRELQVGYRFFEQTHRLPPIVLDDSGRYVCGE